MHCKPKKKNTISQTHRHDIMACLLSTLIDPQTQDYEIEITSLVKRGCSDLQEGTTQIFQCF